MPLNIKEAMMMAEKPQVKLVPDETATNPTSTTTPPDPFDPANLRLDQSFTETVAVKKLLTTIPVRRPGRQTFFRVHPDPEYRDTFPIIDLKDDREEYIVARALVPELASEIVLKQLCLAITRQGVVFFLPLRLPSPDGLGAYEAWMAADNLSEPEWPELNFWDLIKIAFKDYLITDLNHPVVKRLRGLA
jgi:hypothetical protein